MTLKSWPVVPRQETRKFPPSWLVYSVLWWYSINDATHKRHFKVMVDADLGCGYFPRHPLPSSDARTLQASNKTVLRRHCPRLPFVRVLFTRLCRFLIFFFSYLFKLFVTFPDIALWRIHVSILLYMFSHYLTPIRFRLLTCQTSVEDDVRPAGRPAGGCAKISTIE